VVKPTPEIADCASKLAISRESPVSFKAIEPTFITIIEKIITYKKESNQAQINKEINEKKKDFELKKNKNFKTIKHKNTSVHLKSLETAQLKPIPTKLSNYQITRTTKNKKTGQNKKYVLGSSDKLRIIPLGGCEEVGRNMTVFEYKNDIVIIDMGLQFPEEDQLGIDYIIPNIDYLKGKEKNIRAVVFTHGHLDHIGATPLLMEKLGYPLIIGSQLTVHMIKARQEDYKKGAAKNLKIKFVNSFDENLKLGNFKIKLFPVSHSIMDAIGVILETPVITIIHPGDWKIEHDPIGKPITYHHLSKLKRPSVLMLEALGVAYKTRLLLNVKCTLIWKKLFPRLQAELLLAPSHLMLNALKWYLK